MSQDPSESWWTKVATGSLKYSNQTPRCLKCHCSVHNVDLPRAVRKEAGGSCTSKRWFCNHYFLMVNNMTGDAALFEFYFPKLRCKWYLLWNADYKCLRHSGKVEFWAHPASNLWFVSQWEGTGIHLNAGVCGFRRGCAGGGMPGLGLTRWQSLCLAVWNHCKLCQHSSGMFLGEW